MIQDSPGSLEEQVVELRARIRRLEEALHIRGILLEGEPVPPRTPAPPPAAQVSAPPQVPPAPPPAFVPPPGFGYAAHKPSRPKPSLENRIGSQWFNRIGILAVLIGAAWFLKFAFDNHWIGPYGRVLIGLIAGAGLIVWSEHFQRHGFVAFSYSLKAIGSGVLYLSLWAGLSLYAILPAGVAFAAMILVTAFNGYMSWIRNSELLALYAIAGGLGTPLLVSTGVNHQITLFTYLLILDVAVLILVALRPWSRLLFVAFLGTALFVFGWWIGYYSQAQAVSTAFFLACFFLIFAFAPRLVRAEIIEPVGLSLWDSLAVVILPIANAALSFLAFYGLFTPSAADWAGPWLAVAFSAFYLLLLRLPARGALRTSPAPLSALHLATAVVFLTLAIPLKTHGRWLTIGWLAEGAALLWLASRLCQRLLQVLALFCLALGLVAVLAVNPPASVTPFFNQRFATYAAAIAIFAFVVWLASRAGDTREPQPPVRWPALAAAAVLLVNGLILLAIGAEIHNYWWRLRWHGDMAAFSNFRTHAQFTYSAFFMLFGAALMAVGFWRRSAFLRWQALVLLALTIGKVFLVDMSSLSQGLRILSFLGLGALLLAVSFAYQRDWLNLRGQGE